MSLLLDALKKAADDKQKASQENPIEPAQLSSDSSESSPVSKPDTGSSDQLSLQSVDAVQDFSNSAEELTLDELAADDVELAEKDAGLDELTIEEFSGDDEAETSEAQPPDEQRKPEAARYTVSDEALSMLINKTNQDVKHSKRIVIIGMMLLSLFVLASGGIYYYLDMQAEISALERRHKIAMQSMRSKTSQENTPEQSEIIRNLVSDSDLEDKVEYAKKHIAEEKNTRQVKPSVGTPSNVNPDAASFSFQKTNKVDPIEEKLDEAWSSYDDGEYRHAKNIYSEVLSIEENNRDALLGMGAIAVIEKDNRAARDYYMSLLKLDPRDPIAIAALAGLQSDGSTLESEEKFLMDMLQKNPDAPQLNFALGNVYAQQGKWKFAQQSFFSAWQHDNENADYIFNLAVSMDQLGKQQQAISFYKESLSKSKNKQVSFSRESVQKRITELSEL